MKYSVTIRVDGKNFETKPFESDCEANALSFAEKRARLSFPNAEDVDAVNVEEVDMQIYSKFEESEQ